MKGVATGLSCFSLALLLMLVVPPALTSSAFYDINSNHNDWSSSTSEYNSDQGQDPSGGRWEILQQSRGQVDSHTEWVRRFCSSAGNEFFCQVPRDYMMDDFNWLNLTYDREAMNLLLVGSPGAAAGKASGASSSVAGGGATKRSLQKQAQHVYGLIHARYILTPKGLLAMRDKFEAGHFGRCPRVYCQGQAVLPVSLSEEVGGRGETIKVYCPACKDLFHPQNSYHRTLDGAYWGTTFAHLFLLTFTDLRPLPNLRHHHLSGSSSSHHHHRGGGPRHYEPRIFGFRLRV